MNILVVAVGLLGILNLVLTLAVIRRLGEVTAAHDRRPVDKNIPLTIAPGTTVGEFSAMTTAGTSISRDDLPPESVVAFFSMFCDSCVAKVPSFVEYVRRLPDGPGRTLAIVIGAREHAEPVVAKLEPVARVVVELPDGPVSTAFAVTGFPTYCLVDAAHTLVKSGMELYDLPDPART